MSQSFHMYLDVKGALTNWKKRDFKGMFKHDDGRPMSADEAKRQLLLELENGHSVIPMGKCDNFDFKTGCKGHETKG